jgi:hypothetical protein
MVIQVDSTQDVALTGLCLACTREYLSETVPGIVFAEPGGVRAYLSRGFSRANKSGIADAHRGDGKRFVVHADEKLTAFMELESEISQAKSRILLKPL